MPRISDDVLDEMLDVLEAEIEFFRERQELPPAFVHRLEHTYAALSELQVWREFYPDTQFEPVYPTLFGPLPEQ